MLSLTLKDTTSETILLIIIKTMLSAEFYLIYLHTAEVFPTSMRGRAFGIVSLLSRFAIVASDLPIGFSCIAHNLVTTAALLLVIGVLSIALEDTYGKELEEMIDQSKDPLTSRLLS